MASNTDNDNNANGSEDESTVADAIGEAVRSIEDATKRTVEAALKNGEPDRAQRVAAAVVEAMDRAVSDLEDAAEATEEVAEEVAENAPPGEAAEAAEEAVEAARDANEEVEDAEAEIREETREQGGGEATEAAAVDQAIHAEAEEVRDERPVEEAPQVDAMEAVEQEVADIQDDAPVDAEAHRTPPSVIAPEASHPYYRKRKVTVFGRTFEL